MPRINYLILMYISPSATAPINLQCVSTIGDVTAQFDCTTDIELVSIQCVIDNGAPQTCKLLSLEHSISQGFPTH